MCDSNLGPLTLSRVSSTKLRTAPGPPCREARAPGQKPQGRCPPVFAAFQMDDEDSILPRKLQVALEHILEHRNDLAGDQDEGPPDCKHGNARPPPRLHLPLPL